MDRKAIDSMRSYTHAFFALAFHAVSGMEGRLVSCMLCFVLGTMVPGMPSAAGIGERAVASANAGQTVRSGSGTVGSRTPNYTRVVAAYEVPDVMLLAHDGASVEIADSLGVDRAVMVNFVFTSCTTICPILSASFAEVGRRLKSSGEHVDFYSISIDPEYDTRDRISEYAKKVGAGDRWRFVTGSLDDTFKLEKAFDTYRGNKMNHLPLTFMKPAGAETWVRIEGFPSAEEILAEYRSIATP